MVTQGCRIITLKIGHRPERDKRLTTHLGLVARAFGAQGFWFTGLCDPNVFKSLQKVCSQWGNCAFDVQNRVSWRECVREWKEGKGEVVHLTMYGLHVDNVISRIRTSPLDKLVVIGGVKVPHELFTIADYNVAIGHSPHSEVAALAVFLDRFFQGYSLRVTPSDAKLVIEPQPHGKFVRKRKSVES